MYHK